MMWRCFAFLAAVLLSASAWSQQTPPVSSDEVVAPPPPPPPASRLTQVKVAGRIEGENISFRVEYAGVADRDKAQLLLIRGDVVMTASGLPDGATLAYQPTTREYLATFERRGDIAASLEVAARALRVEQGAWREVTIAVPDSPVRHLEVACDRTDLEIAFPGAMRVERRMDNGKLIVTAVQGPGRDLTVRWKPQIPELEGRLVFTSNANTVVSVGPGAMRLDALFALDVAQGKLAEVSFALPPGLSVTQVRGLYIRDWKIVVGEASGASPAARTLVVTLNRPQTRQYSVQVMGEMPLATLPAQVDLPVVTPLGGIRASGQVCVGTDSAIQLVVKQTTGLAQIEAPSFGRVVLDDGRARTLPRTRAFYYNHAAGAYQMRLALDDIVPMYDAVQRVAVVVREEDLGLEAQIELDVRDAPLRAVTLSLPGGFTVAAVNGTEVADYTQKTAADGKTPLLEVHFRRPLLGRTLVSLKLELGKTPLGTVQHIAGLSVLGAANERGYVVVAADGGIVFDRTEPDDAQTMRRVHPASVPMRVANTQYALRFRQAPWGVTLLAHKRPAGVRAEAFHIVSLGDGVVYGNVVVTYLITGSPVDQLAFRVPEELEAIEFVGADVRRWDRDPKDPTRCVVRLQRRVIGEYNLAVTYNQRYQDKKDLAIGAIECADVESQSGYITVASHLNLSLASEGKDDPGLLEIQREEVPDNYRLMVSAPVLRSYKYLGTPHRAVLRVSAYERGSLLPVIVEITDLSTRIATNDRGPVDWLTTVRYKVKNASNQFLELAMPAGTRDTWRVSVVGDDGQLTKIAASFDKARGMLMIPLPRLRNPNDPTTIQVEYGQEHAASDGLTVTLESPGSAVPSTFDAWQVSVPPEWSVRPGETATMVPTPRAQTQGDVAAVMTAVARSWARGLDRWVSDDALPWAALAGVAVLVLVFFVHRPSVPDAALLLVLAGVMWMGVHAARPPAVAGAEAWRDDLTSLRFTQAVNAEAGKPMSVQVRLTPAWRQHATVLGSVVMPAAALLALVGAWAWRGGRGAMIALALGCLAYGAAQFPAGAAVLGHVFTWGVPAGVLAAGVWRLALAPMARRMAMPAGATAMVLALMLLGAGGCASVKPVDVPPMVDRPVLERVESVMTAERDSLTVNLTLKVRAESPMRFVVMDSAAVQLSPSEMGPSLRLTTEDNQHVLHVRSKGEHEVTMQFIRPLPTAGEDSSRGFRMPMPMAMSNQVRLTMPATEVDVEAPTAVRLVKSEAEGRTTVEAILGPGEDAAFVWRPRARERRLETTSYYVDLVSAMRCDAGLVESRNLLRFQVAQGELQEMRLSVPEGLTVTTVEGRDIGAWRFDPATRELEVRLTKAATVEYRLEVVTQASLAKLPYTVKANVPTVSGAMEQRGIVGLLAGPTVSVSVVSGPQPMNVDDFVRDASALLTGQGGYEAGSVRQAFRVQGGVEAIEARVEEVRPELRVTENAVFTVADEKLSYNGELVVDITKAGVFTLELWMPSDYDIDALGAAEVSHWDDVVEGGLRKVQVHLKGRLQGKVGLKVALSRPVSELPASLSAPRVTVTGAIKHLGQLVVSSDRGVRLAVTDRAGVSEVEALEAGLRDRGALAFRLLQPEWSLKLQTEVLEPRVNVDFVHVARVSEGSVRHSVHLRHRLHNAGAKVFEVRVPKEARGLQITGPDIVRRDEVSPGSGHWRVELAGKWFDDGDRPYPLTVAYETMFDRQAGKALVTGVKSEGAELQRGYVAVLGSQRVEVTAEEVGPSMQSDEARTIPREVGAGDLSGAVLCYVTNTPDYRLTLGVVRHDSAGLLEAEVKWLSVQTVVTERGQMISRVQAALRVGGKRHLATTLPAGAQVWSLLVNGKSTVPSLSGSVPGVKDVVLVPLAQSASGDLDVEVELIYVTSGPSPAGGGALRFEGPRFDLPLKDVSWSLYLPERYEYGEFGGTLNIDRRAVEAGQVQRYDSNVYEEEQQRFNQENRKRAVQLQSKGVELAQQGRNAGARQALEWAYNYSQADPALNEDMRVQLRSLSNQQAMVGLVQQRARVKQQTGEGAEADLGDRFNVDQANKITSNLSAEDADNLGRITRRVVEDQFAAAGESVQLTINMPLGGRVVQFARPHQVNRNAEMVVTMGVKPMREAGVWSGWAWTGAMLAGLLGLLWAAPAAGRRVRPALRAAFTPRVKPAALESDEPMEST